MCKDIQTCKDIDTTSFKQRCGWCERLQKGIPVTNNGKAAYPWNKIGGCPSSKIITSGSRCPANPPPDEDEETIPDPCEPLADGRVSRACVLSKYKEGGCSDNGAIGRALASGNDHDYMNSIYSQKAYEIYKQRSSVMLNEAGLKSGNISVNDALNEFDRLATAASSKPSGGNALNYASRDLCLNQGEMNSFDFCTELTDSSVGPYTLECLRKAFANAGGQVSGSLYPSNSTISYWNTFPKWKDVLAEMQKVAANITSKDRKLKFNATTKMIDVNAPEPFECDSSLLPRNVTLSRGNVIGRFTMVRDYKLEFDITPRAAGGWGSIFHFTADGENCCNTGQRSPAIWFIPGTLNLLVCVGDTTDANWGFFGLVGCQANKKSRITLECRGKSVKVTIDANVYTATQPTTRYTGPTTVFASDPWHEVPNATLQNVCFNPYGN